jgi:penicillin-binding protein 2
LAEGVIDKNFTITCNGYFPGCGNGKPKCLDKGTFNLTGAIAHSDNSYFATVYKRLLDQQRYGSADSALKVFNKYAYSFGLGNRLGIDMPSEKKGNLPLSSLYEKRYGSRWVSCNCISNSIGQGEVLTTITQMANVMATIANKGWYYTPHLVDSIEGGDKYDMLAPYKVKHQTENISSSYFEAVHNGMQGVMEYGTGAAAQVPGIVVCGKTGTVENYDHGVKQKDHAFFGAFAPRDNPRIAIAVMCENAGFGASSAAPIASLLIEKYLKDSITDPARIAEVDRVTKLNLIPARMLSAMATQDSLKKVKEALRILQEQEALKDSASGEEGNSAEPEANPVPVKPNSAPAGTTPKKSNAPAKKAPAKRNPPIREAALPGNDERNNNRNNKRV